MELFVIRQKSTGFLLPINPASSHRSSEEFTDKLPPRVFLARGPALRALAAWRKGEWRTAREFESTNKYGGGFYYQGTPAPSFERPERKADDYEVVPAHLDVRP